MSNVTQLPPGACHVVAVSGQKYPIHLGILAEVGLACGARVDPECLSYLLTRQSAMEAKEVAEQPPVDTPFMTDAELRYANVKACADRMAEVVRTLLDSHKGTDPLTSMVMIPLIADATSLKGKLNQLASALKENL